MLKNDLEEQDKVITERLWCKATDMVNCFAFHLQVEEGRGPRTDSQQVRQPACLPMALYQVISLLSALFPRAANTHLA